MRNILHCEMPAEKLERYGANHLNEVELLAILLRTGTREKSPLDLAREIISLGGSFRGISKLSRNQLKQIHGIGSVKSVQIMALLELAKRFHKEDSEQRIRIHRPADIANYFQLEMQDYSQEHFKVILLNTKNEMMENKDLFIGTVNRALVSPREIFEYALKNSAVSVIFIHNHPSGDPEPSVEDIAITEKCAELAKMFDITLLDHIVIGKNRFVSLKERQLF